MFLWKLSQGLVTGYAISFTPLDGRTGRKAVSASIPRTPACLKNAREGSLAVKGVALFNSLPISLRNSDHGDTAMFKNHLDIYLGNIPDQPTMAGLARGAQSNSLLHQIPMYEKSLMWLFSGILAAMWGASGLYLTTSCIPSYSTCLHSLKWFYYHYTSSTSPPCPQFRNSVHKHVLCPAPAILSGGLCGWAGLGWLGCGGGLGVADIWHWALNSQLCPSLVQCCSVVHMALNTGRIRQYSAYLLSYY